MKKGPRKRLHPRGKLSSDSNTDNSMMGNVTLDSGHGMNWHSHEKEDNSLATPVV